MPRYFAPLGLLLLASVGFMALAGEKTKAPADTAVVTLTPVKTETGPMIEVVAGDVKFRVASLAMPSEDEKTWTTLTVDDTHILFKSADSTAGASKITLKQNR
jgi:hypothetical protein